MKFYRYDAITGRIQVGGAVPNAAALALQQIAGAVAVEGEANPSTQYVDVSTGSLVSIPAAPTGYHHWDATGHAWVADLVAARAAGKQEIDRERERRNELPIAYAGTLFDADATAQRNVSAWQTQLAAGATLPTGFAWRDFENVDHPADAAFVNGLGAAITLRGTMLYVSAWAHKAALDALSDVDSILSYNATGGWPE